MSLIYIELSSFPKTTYWSHYLFSIVYSCLLCQRLIVCVSVYFWALYSVPLIHVSIFVPISCSFDYYSLVVLFELSAVDLCFPKSSTVIGTGRYVEICFLTKPIFKLQLDVTAEPSAGKYQFSFQSQRGAVPKNVHTTTRLCLFHILVRLCSKSFKLVFSTMWTENFQMYKLGLERAGEPQSKLPTFLGS